MIEEIASAFNTADASLEVKASYGFGPDSLPTGADVINKVRAGKSVRIIVDVNHRPEFDIAQSTRGVYWEGFVMIYAFNKEPKAALAALRSWWLTIAGDNGNLLHNIEGKKTLGSVEFLHWRAVGGFQGFAQNIGGVWQVDQMVQVAAWSPP